jgi:ribosomal protein S16
MFTFEFFFCCFYTAFVLEIYFFCYSLVTQVIYYMSLRIMVIYNYAGSNKTARVVVGSYCYNRGGSWRILERLGYFNFSRSYKIFYLDSLRLGYWLNHGAQPSSSFLRFILPFCSSKSKGGVSLFNKHNK